MTKKRLCIKAIILCLFIAVMLILLLTSNHANVGLAYQLQLGSISIPLISIPIVISTFIILLSLFMMIMMNSYPKLIDSEGKVNINFVIFDYISTFVFAIYTIFVIFMVFAFPVKVSQTSMMPTISPNERIIVSANTINLKRGDIVVFQIDEDKLFVNGHDGEFWIKRVIGLPGEKISFVDGYLYVNGTLVREDYLMDGDDFKKGMHYNCFMNLDAKYCKSLSDVMRLTGLEGDTIPQGYYLLLGDNRLNSYDSWSIGLVSKDLIVGRAIYKIKSLFSYEKIGE